MPRGVTDQFLKILDNERRATTRTVLAMLVLFLFAYAMAELTDRPLFGRVVLLAVGALVVGVALGCFLAWRRTKKYNESLRDSWNAWMRMSLSSTRVDEVARRVTEKARPLPLSGVGWAALFLANAVLFATLWIEVSWAPLLGIVVTATNGIVLGALAGAAAWSHHWARRFHKALDELVTEGQVGLWGEV